MVLGVKLLEPRAPPRANHSTPSSCRLHALDLALSSVHVLINYDWAGGWLATSFHLSESPGKDVSKHLQMTSRASDTSVREKQHGGAHGVVHVRRTTKMHIHTSKDKTHKDAIPV